MLTMNVLLTVLMISLVCYLNGQKTRKHTYLDDKGSVDLETLPLERLLEMKKELRKKDFPAERTVTTAEKRPTAFGIPNAMALQRRTGSAGSSSSGGSSVQTAFQMSLTVLSFLAFGGYVISLVTQNMRKTPQNDGTTAPQPLNAVVVNQNRRPFRPLADGTAVSYGRRRKRSRRFTRTG